MPISAHFGEVFGGLSLNVFQYCEDPQKAHLWPETRVLVYRSSRSVKKCDLGSRWRKQKKREKKETPRCDKSHVGPDHPRCATPLKLSCGVSDVVNHAKFHQNWFRGILLHEGSKSATFLCLVLWLKWSPAAKVGDIPLGKTGVPLADTIGAGDAKRHFSTPGMTQEDRVSSYYCARYHAKCVVTYMRN